MEMPDQSNQPYKNRNPTYEIVCLKLHSVQEVKLVELQKAYLSIRYQCFLLLALSSKWLNRIHIKYMNSIEVINFLSDSITVISFEMSDTSL